MKKDQAWAEKKARNILGSKATEEQIAAAARRILINAGVIVRSAWETYEVVRSLFHMMSKHNGSGESYLFSAQIDTPAGDISRYVAEVGLLDPLSVGETYRSRLEKYVSGRINEEQFVREAYSWLDRIINYAVYSDPSFNELAKDMPEFSQKEPLECSLEKLIDFYQDPKLKETLLTKWAANKDFKELVISSTKLFENSLEFLPEILQKNIIIQIKTRLKYTFNYVSSGLFSVGIRSYA